MEDFIEPFNISFFSITVQGLELDYCGFEWFALEMNRTHSVIFKIAYKYCISDFFVDYDGYSISSKGFLHPQLGVVFEVASKYCILESFVDYDGYSFSSKGFLPTVVDIMVILVKFTHSSPF